MKWHMTAQANPCQPAQKMAGTMRIILAAAAFTILTLPSLAQFQADLSPAEMRDLRKTPAVVDLAVGEVGLIPYIRFCIHQGGVYTYGRQGLVESAGEYGSTTGYGESQTARSR